MRRLLPGLILLAGCKDPAAPDFSVSGDWGVEAAAPAENCSFYHHIRVIGTLADFGGGPADDGLVNLPETVSGDRTSVRIALPDYRTFVLSIEEASDRRIRGSYTCGGRVGAWSMVRYG